MRIHQITCPKCKASMKSQAGVPEGQVVPCPKCKHKFAVEAVDEVEIVEEIEVVEDFEVEDAPKKKGPPPPPPLAKRNDGSPARNRRTDRDDAEGERPREKLSAKEKRRGDDDEDERPRERLGAKEKRRGDDDEDERPRERLGAKGNRRQKDDDDEPRPKRKKKPRYEDDEPEENLFLRLKHNMVVRVITWVILLAVLAVVAYLFWDLKMRGPGAG